MFDNLRGKWRSVLQNSSRLPVTLNPSHPLLFPFRRWVREEVHRWVFDNVRGKWQSVLKKPSKLAELFRWGHVYVGERGNPEGRCEVC